VAHRRKLRREPLRHAARQHSEGRATSSEGQQQYRRHQLHHPAVTPRFEGDVGLEAKVNESAKRERAPFLRAVTKEIEKELARLEKELARRRQVDEPYVPLQVCPAK
jgi:hypothetical protein